MSEIILTEGLAPATPAAGKSVAYVKTDGRWYWKDDAGVETGFRSVGAGTGDLLADGSVPLTANWDAAFEISALRFHSDEATLSPLTVVSTAVVVNLNADQVDGLEAAAFVQVDGSAALTSNWDAGAFEITALRLHSDEVTLSPFTVVSTALVANLNADLLDGLEAAAFATAAQGTAADAALPLAGGEMTGNITMFSSETVDGRDLSADGSKLDGVETAADVTDETNVKAALDGATIAAATVVGTDKILGQDVDDSDNLKSFTAQSIADLGGGFTSPLTTKGDVHTYSTVDARLGVGTNGFGLEADDGETTGLKWASKTKALNKIVTGTTYTILAADEGYNLIFTDAAAIAVTLPDTLDTNFQCAIIQTTAAGIPTVTPNTDTINGAGVGVAPAEQWKAMYLTQYAATEWLAIL